MRYRGLGATGLTVSEIGFGAWGIGGDANGAIAYGPADEAQSLAALARAVDLGITFYDTSDFYGYGRSEELIGRALSAVRDRMVIATKVGTIDAAGGHDFSERHMQRTLELSLKRLQTDYIDLYQLHSPPLELLLREERILRWLQDLRARGTIRACGISVRSPEEGLAAARLPGVDCIQVNWNMIDQRALENGLFDLCRERKIGVIGRTPLCFGFLSGKYPAGSAFGPADHRSRWSAAQIERWAGAYRLFESVANGRDQSPAQGALRFCLSHPAVSTVIPGMLSVGQVEENAAASDFGPLAAGEMREFAEIYRRNVFFEAPAGRTAVN